MMEILKENFCPKCKKGKSLKVTSYNGSYKIFCTCADLLLESQVPDTIDMEIVCFTNDQNPELCLSGT